LEIKHDGLCLDYQKDDGNANMQGCNGGQNQQWFVNQFTKEVQTLLDWKCLELVGDRDRNMHICNGGDDQKFFSSIWGDDSRQSSIRVHADSTLCMSTHPDNDNIYAHPCESGNSNQQFQYDTRTMQIKRDGLCVDYDPDSGNVYVTNCHGVNRQTQMWYFDNTLEFKNIYDWKCLDMDGTGNLRMHDCHGNYNQKFLIPPSWRWVKYPWEW